jgi:GAF domain-containing protein
MQATEAGSTAPATRRRILPAVGTHGDAERLRRLQLVTDAALSHLDLDELLGELLTRIRDVLDADTAAVLLRDELRNELVARSAVGLEEEVEQGVRIPIGSGFAGRIAADLRPIVIDDVDHTDVLNPLLLKKGIKSLLGVPLVASDSVTGVLHVGTLEPRFFTFDDKELLELVASRAAIAIEKAHVHDELVRLDQMKLNFVAIASHELRTPAPAVLRHRRDASAARRRAQAGGPQGARRSARTRSHLSSSVCSRSTPTSASASRIRARAFRPSSSRGSSSASSAARSARAAGSAFRSRRHTRVRTEAISSTTRPVAAGPAST